MDDINLKLFANNNEKEKLGEISKLMHDWVKEISNHKIKFRDDNKNYNSEDYFVEDGFFPNYFNQEIKVLFIGREARGISGLNIVNVVMNNMRSDSGQTGSFWRRIFYMTYGIKTKGKVKWEDVPYVYDIENEIIKTQKYSLAIMNFSKYSNDCDDGAKADIKLINRFCEDTNFEKRNFFKEEISILDPDVIITANIWDGKIDEKYLNLAFGEEKVIKIIGDNDACFKLININGKSIKVIDLYHFSRPGVEDKKYYYDPVVKLLFK
ncbi:MAG: hypothetical protein Ta2B_16270 [Termitinemataceae bacterium]|nr:MAG: hypothetical protein Ta2B_16270 [Termitinemataceae bacterium]